MLDFFNKSGKMGSNNLNFSKRKREIFELSICEFRRGQRGNFEARNKRRLIIKKPKTREKIPPNKRFKVFKPGIMAIKLKILLMKLKIKITKAKARPKIKRKERT